MAGNPALALNIGIKDWNLKKRPLAQWEAGR
jgi:hypothetical protein